MKSVLLDKLIKRIDRAEPEQIQSIIHKISKDNLLFEGVFEVLTESIIILDDTHTIIFANRATQVLFGLQPNQLLGKPIAQLAPAIKLDLFDSKEKSLTLDFEISYPEVKSINLFLSSIDLSQTEQLVASSGFVLVFRDVTEALKKSQANQDLQRLEDLSLLSSGVAHEIGNPLNSLGIHLQLLEKKLKKLPETTQADLAKHLDIATREISRVDDILQQFLQATRPQKPIFSAVNLQTLVEESYALIEPELNSRNIHFELSYPDVLPLIPLDANQIKQVVFNLLKNAYQAIPVNTAGQISIHIILEDTHVSLVVSDNGSGISPEMIGTIFEPYTTNKEDGSGIGMLIVRRIIREHYGEIEIESEPNKGTRVTCRIPRADQATRKLMNT